MDWRHDACPAACGWRSDMISIRMWRSVNKRNERRLEVTSALAFLLASGNRGVQSIQMMTQINHQFSPLTVGVPGGICGA